ncbi:MAG: BamA/TamA family outer membrane protein [Myxococcota bacterium]
MRVVVLFASIAFTVSESGFAQTSTSTPAPSKTADGRSGQTPEAASTQPSARPHYAVPEPDELTTPLHAEQEPGTDFGRQMLDLPQNVIELGFTPLYVLTYALERYRLAERALDLFTNDAMTLGYLPIVIPAGRSGPGFGAVLGYNKPLGSPDRFILLGLANTNGDYNVLVEFGRRLPFVRGRAFSAQFQASVDRDSQFFGIGSEANGVDDELLRQDALDFEIALTVLPPSVPVLTAEARLAYRRRELAAGDGDGSPIFDGTGDLVAPPAFEAGPLDYPEGSFEFGVDTRNSFGLTSRGFIWASEARVTHDLNGGNTGGIRGQSQIGWFIPLLLRNRTLFLRAGFATAVPLRERDDVPFHFLVNLGGSDSLRGYQDQRFVDEMGWWGTVEYRWFFYELEGTGGGLVSGLFFDMGQVGQDIGDLFDGNFPWSAGLSLRVEQSLIMLGRLQLGFSPEGVQVSFAIGDVP